MIFLVFLLVVSIIINVVMFFGIQNLFKKIDLYEDSYLETKNKLNKMYNELINIDDMQLFEKDDYVGATFDSIKELVKTYNDDI